MRELKVYKVMIINDTFKNYLIDNFVATYL